MKGCIGKEFPGVAGSGRKLVFFKSIEHEFGDGG